MRVSRIFSGICAPFPEGGPVFCSGGSVGGRLATPVSHFSLLCESRTERSSFAELRALDPLCGDLLPRLPCDREAIGRRCKVIARHPAAASPTVPSQARFDAKSYWETRAWANPTSSGYTGSGARYSCDSLDLWVRISAERGFSTLDRARASIWSYGRNSEFPRSPDAI